jgi:hypothetical protein
MPAILTVHLRDCHAANVLVTSLDGSAATAVVADLSLAKALPRRRGVTLDVLAILHLVLTLVVGLPTETVDGNYKQARQLSCAKGKRELEDSLSYIWDLHGSSLRSWVLLHKSALSDPLRLQGVHTAVTVIQRQGIPLSDLRWQLTRTDTHDQRLHSVLQMIEAKPPGD